ncbi:transmembrane protein, putative [Actinidia rufa]|uniref:Transmembrane protein, putative n=1 Tax=Actinidia rufa TaxID=165716 RepID=A0A7J0H873_9ERIC|nr:transmembrane protein, putative [Actinidia rufa]
MLCAPDFGKEAASILDSSAAFFDRSSRARERKKRREKAAYGFGGLGAGGDRGSAVRGADAWAVVSAAGKKQSGGIQQYADEWRIHTGSHHHLLRPHYHFPHRNRHPHLFRLTDSSSNCWSFLHNF